MGAPLNGQLDALFRDEIDSRYRVSEVENLNDGFTFDGMRRYVKNTKEYYILKGDIWELVGSNTTPYVPDPVPIAYLHRGNSILPIINPNDLNITQSGDNIYFNTVFTLSLLILKDGVTYYTNNIPASIGTITDNGIATKAKVLGGMPPSKTSRRFIAVSGATSIITIEADTYFNTADTSTSIQISNGATLYHKGDLYGGGGLNTVANITGSSKYYHTGNANFFGGFGIIGNDNSYIEMREDSPTLFNFRPAIQLKGNSVCDYYGGVYREYTNNSLEGINFILTSNSRLNLRDGIYQNLFGNPVVRLDSNSILSISSLVELNSNGTTINNAGDNPINKHYGATITGTITSEIINLPADKYVEFKQITTNQYGTHPDFYNQDDLNAFLLGNNQSTPQETLVINSVTAQ